MLVVGMGNVLRGDDGFGVAVAERLLAGPVPAGVEVMDAGIGGIHLVQELMGRSFDCLVVVDAVRVGAEPGTVVVIEPEVADVTSLPLARRHDSLADMHYAEPERAMMLASALGALPGTVRVIGCQPEDETEPRRGLSPPVERAVATAVEQVRMVAGETGIAWDGVSGIGET